MNSMGRGGTEPVGTRGEAAFAVAVVIALSAVFFETDSYRYGLGLAALVALTIYLRSSPRVNIGWAGSLSIAWGVYVLARIGNAIFFDPATSTEGNEGIYAFPLVFPTIGYVIFFARGRFADLAIVFMVASLGLMLVSTDLGTMAAGVRHSPLFHENPIHGSVSAGLVFMASLGWVEHFWATRKDATGSRVAVALGVAVLVLSTINIVAGNSKGVWAAVVVALLFHAVLVARRVPDGRSSIVIAGTVALAVMIAVLFEGRIQAVISAPVSSIWLVLKTALASNDPFEAISLLLKDGDLAKTVDIRLALIMNSLEIWRDHFWFGAGAHWQDYWAHARFDTNGFTIKHNGFLEIAVRYGAFGLIVVTAIMAACAWNVRRARDLGLLSPAIYRAYLTLMVFFLITNLSNSNNNFPFGESFIVMWCGFGFTCQYILQAVGAERRAADRSPQDGAITSSA